MAHKYTSARYLIEFAFLFYHIFTIFASIFYILHNFNDYTLLFNDLGIILTIRVSRQRLPIILTIWLRKKSRRNQKTGF